MVVQGGNGLSFGGMRLLHDPVIRGNCTEIEANSAWHIA
jgi:hypothetical protein